MSEKRQIIIIVLFVVICAISAVTFSARQGGHSQNRSIQLEVRGSGHGHEATSPNTERDSHHVFESLRLSVSRLALVLIDVWDEHPVRGWAERADENIRTKLLPLVQAARENGILVIHSPYHRAISPIVTPLPGEPVIGGHGGENALVKILKARGVVHLLYAGYSSNMCVLTRPTGIIEMVRNGYRIIFVRDASIAMEAPEFLAGQLTHGVMTYMVETNWGLTTEVDQVLAALSPV